MRVCGWKGFWVFVLGVFLVCSLLSVCAGKETSEEFDAVPQSGFWAIADGIAVSSFSLGSYVLETRSGTAWGRLDLKGIADFSAATRIRLSAGISAQAAGIVFDYRDERSFCVFLIKGDGSCGLWKFDGGAFRVLADWRKEGAILPAGEWNAVAVTVADGYARCSVNARQVLAVPHASGTGGDVGVAAVAWGGGQASFDYLRLCDLGAVHSYSVSIKSMTRVAYAGEDKTSSHYASVDGGSELRILGDRMVIDAGQFSGTRVVHVKIHTVRSANEVTEDGEGSVDLVLYSCDSGSQEQIVRVRVCKDPGSGPDCGGDWADWEYVLQVDVD